MNFRFELPIQTERNLHAFVQAAFGVKIPNVQVCPHHSTPWRAFKDAFFAVSPVVVMKASRGFGGKSFLVGVLGMTEAVLLKAEVAVLGGSGQQAKRVLETMQRLWGRSALQKMLVGEALTETHLSNGASIKAQMASQTSVRGAHPQRLRCDEADEMEQRLLDAALGQPMAKGGIRAQTVIASTHQHADGTFTEIMRRASVNRWPVHEWCYRESLEPHGWLDAEQIQTARLTMPESMWATEVEGQEPNPEGRAFDPLRLERMFSRDLGVFEGRDGEHVEIEAPVPGARYAHGADWAKKVDRTIIMTWRVDCSPMRLVAFEAMRRLPWPVMIGKLDARKKRYGGRVCHDQTGLGDVVADTMRSGAEGVMFVGRARQDLLTDYVAGVERGEVEMPFIRLVYNEHRYALNEDLYGSGHLPDTISAGALTYKAGRKRSGGAFAVA